MVSAPEAVTCEATSHSSQVQARVEHHGIYQLVHPDMQMVIKLLTSSLQYILTHQHCRGEPISSFNFVLDPSYRCRECGLALLIVMGKHIGAHNGRKRVVVS